MRHLPNAVLLFDQLLRHWPNIKPPLGGCTMFVGKANAFVELLTHRCLSSIWTNYDSGTSSQCSVDYETQNYYGITTALLHSGEPKSNVFRGLLY